MFVGNLLTLEQKLFAHDSEKQSRVAQDLHRAESSAVKLPRPKLWRCWLLVLLADVQAERAN